MKKILVLFLALSVLVGCKEPKAFVTLSGKIENADTKEIEILSKDYIKTITLNNDGTFKDTLKVTKGIYTLTDGRNKTVLYLANGYDLKIDVDALDFSTIAYNGNGKESNDYVLAKINFSKTDYANPKTFFTLERTVFKTRIEELKKMNASISTTKVDSVLISQIEIDNKRYIDYLEKNYELKYAALINFAKGKPSPKFSNYENYDGSTTSLSDLKGKYVYIDVWATWCGPCKQQIPYLKKVEEEYHGKNIAFVSISTDRQNKHAAWKKMIEDRQMGGIQLFAGTDYSFAQEYQINSIPRFILIDPDGNIVDANAPRPSEPSLKTLFNSLDI
ncbi:MAG: TlpA family protein disulfide reductase [Urechidicola sp.]|nr:TlpA family protein disulfide reductase [Urechidicola sp.]